MVSIILAEMLIVIHLSSSVLVVKLVKGSHVGVGSHADPQRTDVEFQTPHSARVEQLVTAELLSHCCEPRVMLRIGRLITSESSELSTLFLISISVGIHTSHLPMLPNVPPRSYFGPTRTELRYTFVAPT
jgi:hypothetical protein